MKTPYLKTDPDSRKPNFLPKTIIKPIITVISNPNAAPLSSSPVKLYSKRRMESGLEW